MSRNPAWTVDGHPHTIEFHGGGSNRDPCTVRRGITCYRRDLRRALGDLFRLREQGRDDGDAR